MCTGNQLSKYQKMQLKRHPEWSKPCGVIREWLYAVLQLALVSLMLKRNLHSHAPQGEAISNMLLLLLAAVLLIIFVFRGWFALDVFILYKREAKEQTFEDRKYYSKQEDRPTQQSREDE